MKTVNKDDVLTISFYSSPCSIDQADVIHIPRGVILAGVLNGVAGYDSVPVITDTPCCDNEPAIDYNPETDQRLDRFDAIEMGIEAIDEKIPTPNPGGESEKKE